MKTRKPILILAVLVALAVAPVLSFAQGTPAPSFTPEQLDKLVAPIALYPDALLAQVLAAATYSDQIPDAARWAEDRKSTRLNSSHQIISYAVFCLKKKKKEPVPKCNAIEPTCGVVTDQLLKR